MTGSVVCPVCGTVETLAQPHTAGREVWRVEVTCDHEDGYTGGFTLWENCLGERRWLFASLDRNSQYVVVDGRAMSNDQAVRKGGAAESAGALEAFRSHVRTKWNLRCECGIDVKATKGTLGKILDRFAADGVSAVSLRVLAGKVSS